MSALGYFCLAHDHFEDWADWMESALSLGGEVSSAVRVRALISAGASVHDPDKAENWAREALALATEMNDEVAIAESLDNLGWWARYGGDSDAAVQHFEASLAAWRRSSIKGGIAHGVNCTLGSLADAAYALGDHERARRLYEEAPFLSRAWEDTEYEAGALSVLAGVARVSGEVKAARDLYQNSLVVATRCGSRRMTAEARLGLARIALAEGDSRQATRLVSEALADRLAAGATQYLSRCLATLGEVALVEGSPERAARLFGAAAHHRGPERPNVRVTRRSSRRAYEAAVDRVRRDLGEDAFEAACAEGATIAAADLLSDVLDDA